ncbi:MAG: DegT/DnrJ/EryC1/StrS family aminotransferase [Anaerolineales bacterium]
MHPSVSFVDLRAQHEEVRSEIQAALRDIIDRSSFIGGSYVHTFEKQFAEYLGVKEVVGVANGTDGLWLGMMEMGIGPGDGVITVPNTFIATTEAITRCGARPLFVDIDLATATMDAQALRQFLSEECRLNEDGKTIHLSTGVRVAAILPVHLYGFPADMTPLTQIATEYGLPLVEDACQAHGAKYCQNGQWVRAGSMGTFASFSFYPGKNLGAMGDAGAIATNDAALAARLRQVRDHGSVEKYIHYTPYGWNSRLDALQAAVLAIKLKKLDEWNERRRTSAAYYREAFTRAGLPVALPVEPGYGQHVYHLYVVRVEDREGLRKFLSAQGIGVGLHYPIALHLQKAYQHLGYPPGSFPNAETSAATLLSLPMHQALTSEQIDYVVETCARFYAGH